MKEVVQLGLSVGLSRPAAVTAAAIAKAESGLRTDAIGDTTIQTGTWGPSVGLWQIRSLKAEKGKGTTRDVTRLTNKNFNARSMAAISNHGSDFTPWSTFKDRSYKTYITEAVNAAGGGAMGYGDGPGGWSTGGAGGPNVPGGPTVPGSSYPFANKPVAKAGGPTVPGPGILFEPFGLIKAGAGAVDDAGEQLQAAVLTGLVWTAALGLGASLVLIGAWRLTHSDGS